MEKSIILGRQIPEIVKQETLDQLLAPSFSKYGDKTAFIFKNKNLSYAELDNWSNAIAEKLHSMGIGAGDTVGLWHSRGLELPVAILGIVKSGAAYVPLDYEMPKDRIQKVFTDIQVKTYFSDRDAEIHCSPIAIPPLPVHDVAPVHSNATPDNWCYVLFTSGSTGNPKGIPILHSNICHLIRSEQEVLHIEPGDRVYHGFSVSFDMWCEEIWISLFAGATIWIADATTVKAIDELSDVLIKQKITILHAVPSILAIIDEVPSIRIINSGGEACTKQVQQKWAKPYRTFINSYGPTETTVTSNMAFLSASEELTIGDPLPNYHLAVVDEQMQIVPRGERGEMIISGPGVANGYFNLPDLSAEKFLQNPFSELPGDRIYKTGDAVLIQENGFLEFHGRIDDQIKLRGYRIELGEIESRLNQISGVKSAAVAVKKDSNEQEQLVGYAVMDDAAIFNEDNLRKQLAAFLAPYMVPVTIVKMEEMPRMPSGKINRKNLPLPDSFQKSDNEENVLIINADDAIPKKVFNVLHHVFPGKEFNNDADFFTDLGGHSLLAATVVSHLRKDAGLHQASLKDIYEHRPIGAFIEELSNKQNSSTKNRAATSFQRVSTFQYYLCNLLQTLSLAIIYSLLAIEIIAPYLSYYYFLVEDYSHLQALLSAFLVYCLIPPLFAIIIFIGKWLIVGTFREGDYPLWGWYYFRWWFWNALKRITPSQYIVDTPLYPRYLRMLGVKVHSSAQLSAVSIGAEDLVSIGKNVSTSSACALDNASVENGWLKLRKIEIGDHCYLGSSSVVCGGAKMERNSELQDLSCLHEGDIAAAGEVWNGSPAVKSGQNEIVDITIAKASKRNRFGLLYLCTLFIFPLVVIIPLVPTLYTLYVLDDSADDYDFSYLWQTPLLAISYLLIFMTVMVLLSRILQTQIKKGRHSIYSFTYYAKWIKDQLMNISLVVFHSLYATIYISFYYRLLGAKVGKNSEISTASDVTHNLLEIGDGSFIADAVVLGEHDVRNEELILEKTKIGNNSFVGNSGVIPQNYVLDDNMLIGVLSKAPSEEALKQSGEKDWFGSPPIGLPLRQKFEQFNDALTYNPSLSIKIKRGFIEALRIILPQTFILISSVFFIAYSHDLLSDSFLSWIIYLPAYYLVFMGLPLFLITVLLKWVLVGVYKKSAWPMYSHKVWLSEAITTAYESLCVPFFLDSLRGTMWLPIMLRLLGTKLGKRVWLNTTDITEYDMVTIGNEAMLNEDCGPQTHLFEDRIMKIGSVHIGERSTIGTRSIILYDSEIGNDVHVGALSLIMKGEELPDQSNWVGSPVRPN